MKENETYILILGAGLMQRPSLEAAKELGYKTLVVDANARAVCVPFADRFEPVDLKDLGGLLSLANSVGERLAAVFTAGTDFSASVSYVAQQCGLPAHTFEAALNASNKIKMRECFKSCGVRSPAFRLVERSEIASFLRPEILGALEFPKVVKPIDNMGARGCRLVRSQEEFLHSIEEAARHSRSGGVILEDYMEGPEFSIDALVYNGTLTITGFADRHIFYSPYFIEMGHTMPSTVSPEKKAELIKTFAEGVVALGLTHGAAKADIKYTKNGPMIGEIAARLSGGYMSGWTYPYASGLNLTKQALLLALGKEPVELLEKRTPLAIDGAPLPIYDVPCTNVSAERAWISIPGTVDSVEGIESAFACPFVQNVFVRSKADSVVDFPRNNVEKCGNIITVSPDRELSVTAAEKAVSQVRLPLKKAHAATEAFLARKNHYTEGGFPPDAYMLSGEQRAALEQFCCNVPKISMEKPMSEQIPSCLADCADTLKDWNHRTLRETLLLFDQMRPQHGEMASADFWDACMRGGLQGILYREGN